MSFGPVSGMEEKTENTISTLLRYLFESPLDDALMSRATLGSFQLQLIFRTLGTFG